MSGIKYYALDENEEVPYEFVVTRNVNGEPEFYASFVNTNSLAYGNGVLLKLHERNDELRAENARLREERDHWHVEQVHAYGNWEDAHKRAAELESDNAKLRELVAEMFNACPMCVRCAHNHLTVGWYGRMRELGVEP